MSLFFFFFTNNFSEMNISLQYHITPLKNRSLPFNFQKGAALVSFTVFKQKRVLGHGYACHRAWLIHPSMLFNRMISFDVKIRIYNIYLCCIKIFRQHRIKIDNYRFPSFPVFSSPFFFLKRLYIIRWEEKKKKLHHLHERLFAAVKDFPWSRTKYYVEGPLR